MSVRLERIGCKEIDVRELSGLFAVITLRPTRAMCKVTELKRANAKGRDEMRREWEIKAWADVGWNPEQEPGRTAGYILDPAICSDVKQWGRRLCC